MRRDHDPHPADPVEEHPQGQPPSPTVQATVGNRRKREKRLKAVRRRSGISSVIGEVLILAIVIGLMTGVIVFYNALVGPIQQDSKSTAQQAEASLKERFLIEDVKFLPGNEMNVTVFNFGDISISIATVYINGIIKPFDVPPPSIIGQRSSGWFVLSYDPSSDGTYKVKVVTGRGTMSEADFSPPGDY